jgi:lysylphosphatidylglycerol synthetase-like protein (DUF2156 family)
MKKNIHLIRLAPRVITLAASLFLSVFSLDELGGGRPIFDQISGFLIHSIPSFVLLTVLAIAWKWAKTGGLILTFLGVIFTPLIFVMNYRHNHSVLISLSIIGLITLPIVLAGVLFMVSDSESKQKKQISTSH